MRLDPEVLARVQFAFTVTFHIIFPTMSIGLAAFLVVVEGLWLKTKEPIYLQIYRFWMGIFAMGFGVGVVTGIVLSFEFGLGFAKFAQIAGPAIGPMIGLEVLTAFFLEAGFLGIMLFGLHRVGPKLHFFATCMVALGTQFSASWIMSANSWMQTPDGITNQNGRVVVTNWLRVVDNPSWLVRLPHMLMAAFITGSFLSQAWAPGICCAANMKPLGAGQSRSASVSQPWPWRVNFLSETSFMKRCFTISRPRCRQLKASGKRIPHRPHPTIGLSFQTRRISVIASRSARPCLAASG